MRSHRIIEYARLLALATGCTPERVRRDPVQARAVAGVATVTSSVALGVPRMLDTFVVITDRTAAAARAAGSLLPRITEHFDAGVVAKRGDDICYRYPRTPSCSATSWTGSPTTCWYARRPPARHPSNAA